MCQRRQKSDGLTALYGESKFCGNRRPIMMATPTAMSL